MSALAPRPGRLAHAPIVLRGGQWWWISGTGSIPVTDPTFTTRLDGFAQAVAAADRAVADLRARQREAAASDSRGRR
ncbi:hypothetical protein [Streptomyces sp. NPDC059080]|uniref:hypothetical protein n=1 Tax=Streptomyces sp. NPDC059080 TaxID=3346718 RepID=UPI00367D99F8